MNDNRRSQRDRAVALALTAILVVLVSVVAGVELSRQGSAASPGPALTAAARDPSPPTVAEPTPAAVSDPPVVASSPVVAATPVSTATPTSPVESDGPDRPPVPRPPIPRDALANVVTDDLRVRTKPGVSEDSIKLEPLLWDGALAWVIDGPVAASGYEWYLVEPLGEVDLAFHPDPPGIGWVAAAGKDGEPWLVEEPVQCHETPFDWLSEFNWPPADRSALACYGDGTVRFSALIARPEGSCGTDAPWRIEPAWLDGCYPPFVLADPDPDYPVGYLTLGVAVDPGLDLSALPVPDSGEWLLVEVTGQHDHPAAQTCRAVQNYASSEPAPDPRLVVRDCRARFVVTSVDAPAER